MNIAINIAKLYEVSLDYIAGLTNDKKGLTKSSLTPEQEKLLKEFNSLDERDKGRLLERLDVLKNN